MIQFQHVTKQYQDTDVLADLSLSIAGHELLVLVGPSGSGKAKLLKVVNQLNEPTNGYDRGDT